MSTITYANIQPVTEADFIRRDRQYELLQQLYIIKTTRVLLQENSLSRSLSTMNLEHFEPFNQGYENIYSENDVPKNNSSPQQQLMVPYSSEIQRVLTIMTSIVPDITTIPWLSVLHLNFDAGICLGDLFELTSFLPALRVLESSSIMTHDSVTHYCDSDYKSSDEDEQSDLEDEELSKIDKDLRSFRKDEWMDMSDYETQLRSNYMPLQGSQVTAVHLSYKERHSAQVILSSERLCKWFYPHLRQLEVEGFLHARRNGIWDCPDYGDCRVHADN